jgi:hypothetical protein
MPSKKYLEGKNRLNSGDIPTPKELKEYFTKDELAEILNKKLITIHSLKEINERLKKPSSTDG